MIILTETNVDSSGVAFRMSSQKKFVPFQKIVGMQTIDLKGTLVGTVRDVAVNVTEKEMALIVATRGKTDMEIPWSQIQSIEDVVLLNKAVEVPALPTPPSLGPPATATCPNCGAAIPAHAKFCPKCGSKRVA